MKIKFLIPALALSASLMAFSGCKKETMEKANEQTKDAASSAADAMKNATEAVKDGTEKAVEKVKEGAETVKEEVKAAVAPAPDQAQSIIDKAQSLVNEGKYQDALSALGGLSGMTLSEAQQKMVDALKEQIQKALAGGLPLGK